MRDEKIPVWNYVPGLEEAKHPNFVVKGSDIEQRVRDVMRREKVLVADDVEDVSDLRVGDVLGGRWKVVGRIGENARESPPADPSRGDAQPASVRCLACGSDVSGEARDVFRTRFHEAVAELVGELVTRSTADLVPGCDCGFCRTLAKVKAMLEAEK